MKQLTASLEQTDTYVRVYPLKLPTAQQIAVVYGIAPAEYKDTILIYI